jgi:hypothetical protein
MDYRIKRLPDYQSRNPKIQTILIQTKRGWLHSSQNPTNSNSDIFSIFASCYNVREETEKVPPSEA